jgi:hypothetical protein
VSPLCAPNSFSAARAYYAESVKWTRRAADQGLAIAQYSLGDMYQFGYGAPQDYAEALRWYRRAADQGLPIAVWNLGVMYDCCCWLCFSHRDIGASNDASATLDMCGRPPQCKKNLSDCSALSRVLTCVRP